MSYLTITPDDSGSTKFEQEVQLEGVVYVFRFNWASRESCFYMNLSDQDGVPIATGVKLVVDWPLLLKYKASNVPPGRLILLDQSLMGKDIQQPSDFGTRCVLTYLSSDDPDIALVDQLASP